MIRYNECGILMTELQEDNHICIYIVLNKAGFSTVTALMTLA